MAQGLLKQSYDLKIKYKKGSSIKSPSAAVKCGCGCGNTIEIFYNKEGLEIAGIDGSLKDWKKLLMPLLEGKING
jgi:hypothetical protein